jgi:hypothetical protein
MGRMLSALAIVAIVCGAPIGFLNTAHAKGQKDIVCGANSDKDDVEKSATEKEAGKAVDKALGSSKTVAEKEQLDFAALHCPLAGDPTCKTKKNPKRSTIDAEAQKVKSVAYNARTKLWDATATTTWSASFDCVAP